VGTAGSTCRKLKYRSQGNPKVSLKHRKRTIYSQTECKIMQRQHTQMCCDDLLAERKVSVPLTLVSDIFYQKQPRIRKFPDGKTVTYVCDKVTANQAPNQVLSSQTHSKSCSTNCTQTTYPQTLALGTTLTV